MSQISNDTPPKLPKINKLTTSSSSSPPNQYQKLPSIRNHDIQNNSNSSHPRLPSIQIRDNQPQTLPSHHQLTQPSHSPPQQSHPHLPSISHHQPHPSHRPPHQPPYPPPHQQHPHAYNPQIHHPPPPHLQDVTSSTINKRKDTGHYSSSDHETSSKPTSDSLTSHTFPPPKRHKPVTLNLNGTNNADLALRIVSPGLISLNDEMKSTVKLSHKIHQQQRNLIALRNGKDLNSRQVEPTLSVITTAAVTGNDPNSANLNSDQKFILETIRKNKHSDGVILIANPPKENPQKENPPKGINEEQPPNSPQKPIVIEDESPTYAADDTELTRLSEFKNKKMKRNNIPQPLTIDPSTNSIPISSPSILSAPIRTIAPDFRGKKRQLSQAPPAPGPPPPPQASITVPQFSNSFSSTSSSSLPNIGSIIPSLKSNRNGLPPNGITPLPPQLPQHQSYTYGNQSSPPPPSNYNPLKPVTRSGVPPRFRTHGSKSTSAVPFTLTPTSSSQSQANIQYQQQQESIKASLSNQKSAVTDVFNDNHHRAAPLNSQPPSTRREFFTNGQKNIILENDENSNQPVPQYVSVYPPPQTQYYRQPLPPQGQIDPNQKPYPPQPYSIPIAPSSSYGPPPPPNTFNNGNISSSQTFQLQQVPDSQSPLKSGEIFGSVNFMNENVFNFRIYEKKDKEDEKNGKKEEDTKGNDKKDDKTDEEIIKIDEEPKRKRGRPSTKTEDKEKEKEKDKDKKEEKDKEKDKDKKEESVELDKNKEIDLSYQKEKFMKICETCWDEFVKTRKEH
ncbi:uncharacterized protein KGF55_005550 [Candida pseudojiufengensis]|uniref:uncharacterized protein n=1 Tax=Candida pseudojiufengensis TaxID=497109 RepID=UPI00222543E6|nr:uncharacterized protein KGF55_005550 [Candida pseudojiufengensis]KAI5959060.1 hypothetical protein KGF55_005550 [Candida pseudojiufengensis]